MIDIEYYLSKLQKNTFAIFLFHGVINKATTEVRNYTSKHLLAKEFEKLIKKLGTRGNPVSMDEILLCKQHNRKLPPYSYAVTFDDGFENNFKEAAPILSNYSTPATFYISTHLINENAMTWIDKVEYCLEKTVRADLLMPWQNDIPVRIDSTKTKIECLDDIRKNVKINSKDIYLDDIVNLVFDQCNQTMIESSNHQLDKKMTWHQVKKLNNDELFTIGGHSHHHLSLGSLDKDELEYEINICHSLLKKKGDIVSAHYSYPEGQSRDFSTLVITELKKRGVECCPTAIDGLNNKQIDLFHLKRIMVS